MKDKSIEEIIECTLDEQQCQQECKHKTDRANCPFVTTYPKELFDGIIRISKQSTAPDRETPDWMVTDITRGAKFGYKLGRSKGIESLIEESEQDELWDDIENIFDKHTAPTGGGYEADYTYKYGFISDSKEKYYLIKK